VKYSLIAVVLLSFVGISAAHAQQCQPGQWCSTPTYPSTSQKVQEELQRQEQQWQQQQEQQRQQWQQQQQQQQANRPLCTHAVTNPMTGQTTYVTQPCAY